MFKEFRDVEWMIDSTPALHLPYIDVICRILEKYRLLVWSVESF